MAFVGPDDFKQVKRGTDLVIDGLLLGTGFDHWRFLIYRLDAGGVSTLVFTSDSFSVVPQSLFIRDADDASAFEFGGVDEKFYRIDLVQFDTSESDSVVEDEIFLHVFPDELVTQESQSASLNSTLFSKLLWMLGHNTLNGELTHPGGITQQVVKRGYDSLTTAQAEALLAASENPGDATVQFKSKAVLTTSVQGNEELSLETEQSF